MTSLSSLFFQVCPCPVEEAEQKWAPQQGQLDHSQRPWPWSSVLCQALWVGWRVRDGDHPGAACPCPALDISLGLFVGTSLELAMCWRNRITQFKGLSQKDMAKLSLMAPPRVHPMGGIMDPKG